MDCAPATISCELDRIADQLTGFDINGFLATLIATLIGAFVAGVVSIALYRHEVSNRRKGEIDLAVVALIREIQQYSDRLRRWRVELQAYSVGMSPVNIGALTQIVVECKPEGARGIVNTCGSGGRQATSDTGVSGEGSGVMSTGRSRSVPLWNSAPARTSATNCGALTARHRDWADSISV